MLNLRLLSLVFRAVSLLCFLIALERPAKADPVTAITGAVSLGTNLLGGIFGKKSASKAADIQAAAAARAKQEVIDRTLQANEQIVGGAADVGKQVRTAAGEGTARVDEATVNANKLLDPYRESGDQANAELQRNLVAGGDFNKTPTMADIQIDPGYDWRIKQAQKSFERGAAARGSVQSGGFYKDLNKYVQGEASSEFDKAFERFRSTNADRFNRLNIVAGRGKDVSSESGKNLISGGQFGANLNVGSAEYAGDKNYDATKTTSNNLIDSAKIGTDYDTQAANAKAAGEVTGTNALWGGINAGVNGATSAVRFNKLLKNPALNYFDPAQREALRGVGF